MLRKTATISALLLTILSLNLVAQSREVLVRFSIHGVAEISGDKALVLSGSPLKLEITSAFPESYVAFVYEAGDDLVGFALDITDRSGSVSRLIQVPVGLDSGSLRVLALVFDSAGRPVRSNSYLVTFREGEEKSQKDERRRVTYAALPADVMDYSDKADAKKRAMKKAMAKAMAANANDVGARGASASSSDDTWTLAQEKAAILKAQQKKAQQKKAQQDLANSRVAAPASGGSTWTLAQEKAAIKKANQDVAATRGRIPSGTTLAQKKAAFLKAQQKKAQQDLANSRVAAPASGGSTWTLAQEKAAIKKAQAQDTDG